MPDFGRWDYQAMFGPGNYSAGVQAGAVANQRDAQRGRLALEARQQDSDEANQQSMQRLREAQMAEMARKTREEMEFKDTYQAKLTSGLESFRKSTERDPDESEMADITKRAFIQSAHKLPSTTFENFTARVMDDQRKVKEAQDKLEAQRMMHEERIQALQERNAIMQEVGTMKNELAIQKAENDVLKTKGEEARREKETLFKTAVDIMNSEGSSFDAAMDKAARAYRETLLQGGTAGASVSQPSATSKTRRAVLDPKTGMYRIDLNAK